MTDKLPPGVKLGNIPAGGNLSESNFDRLTWKPGDLVPVEGEADGKGKKKKKKKKAKNVTDQAKEPKTVSEQAGEK